LILICGRQKELDLAFGIYEILIQRSHPDDKVIDSLISACDNANEFKQL
jgi:hypothetical protein